MFAPWLKTRDIVNSATLAAHRFPWSLATAAAIAFTLIYRDDPLVFDNRWGILLLTFLVALPLFTSLTLFWERRAALSPPAPASLSIGTSLIKVLIPGLILAAIFHLTINLFPYGIAQHIRAAHAIVLGLITVPLAWQLGGIRPGTASDEASSLVYWHFIKLLVFWAIVAIAFVLSFCAGIVGAAAGLRELFGVNIPPRFNINVACFLFTFVATWIFLAGLPNQRDGLTDFRFPIILQKFAQYILLPLVIVYLALLYPYAAKILITRTWPSGVVSPLVMAETGLVFGAAALLFPLLQENARTGLRRLFRIFFALSIPLLLLMLVAVGKRVDTYGITESRYYLGLFAIWAIALAIVGILSPTRWLKALAPSLLITAILTWVGPLSASYWSERSQTERLLTLLRRNNLLDAQGKASIKARPETSPSFQDRQAISSSLEYLERYHNGRSIEGLFPLAIASDKDAHPSSAARLASINLRYASPWDREDSQYLALYANGEEWVSITGYDIFQRMSFISDSTNQQTLTWDGLSLQLSLEKPDLLQIFFTPAGGSRELLVLPIREVYDRVRDYARDKQLNMSNQISNIPASLMTMHSESPAGLRVAFVISELSLQENQDQVQVSRLSGFLLVGKVPALSTPAPSEKAP